MNEFVNDTSSVDQNLTPIPNIISDTIQNVNYDKYVELKSNEDGKKIIIQPEGDVNTINIIENPANYGIDLKKAFSILEKDGKKIGASVLYRVNDKNILEEIKNIVRKSYWNFFPIAVASLIIESE